MNRKPFNVLLLLYVPVMFSLLACSTEVPTNGLEESRPRAKPAASGTRERPERCFLQLELLPDVEENETGTFITRTIPGNGEKVRAETRGTCICTEIGVALLAEPHDDLDMQNVSDRAQLRLDGQVLNAVAVSHRTTIADSVTESAFGICWRSDDLPAGAHQAEVTYTRPSGGTERYSWTFELWE